MVLAINFATQCWRGVGTGREVHHIGLSDARQCTSLEVYWNYMDALTVKSFAAVSPCGKHERDDFSCTDLQSPSSYTSLFNSYYDDQEYG